MRYVFIDVQNTASTTQKLLGFIIDWNKLYEYLIKKWKCEKVFFYVGIDEGDEQTAKEFESLQNDKCVVNSKTIFSYKKPDKKISIKCVKCGEENVEVVDMGYKRKSNCDVDLTVDAMEMAGPDKEFLIFTGDGDFCYLIKKLIKKETRVYLISSNAGTRKAGLSTKRFSTKFKNLIRENKGKVDLINIDSWKFIIKKGV